MPRFEVAAFYKFTPLPGYAALSRPLQTSCEAQDVRGTLLLAPEGINATLAGAPDRLARVLRDLQTLTGIDELEIRTSYAESQPFLRMKVRLKAEIVTIGDLSVDPNERTGVRVEPENWNALIADPNVVVIDARNGFEVAIGSFAGAIDPKTASFGDFPAFARATLDPAHHKKVAMFCTGGIRCEKASSLLLREGFETVYQLEGGIQSYLERIAPEHSLWQGACFVFDQRVAVGHGLAVADVSSCFGCRHPLTAEDRASAAFEDGVTCPHCSGWQTPLRRASARERHRQVEIARARGTEHLGTGARMPN